MLLNLTRQFLSFAALLAVLDDLLQACWLVLDASFLKVREVDKGTILALRSLDLIEYIAQVLFSHLLFHGRHAYY